MWGNVPREKGKRGGLTPLLVSHRTTRALCRGKKGKREISPIFAGESVKAWIEGTREKKEKKTNLQTKGIIAAIVFKAERKRGKKLLFNQASRKEMRVRSLSPSESARVKTYRSNGGEGKEKVIAFSARKRPSAHYLEV